MSDTPVRDSQISIVIIISFETRRLSTGRVGLGLEFEC